MASPTSCSCDSLAQITGSTLYSSTPPENNSLPLTPPASCDQHTTSECYVKEWIRALEDCRDPSNSLPTTARIGLPSRYYPQVMRELKRRRSLFQFIDDKVRWNYDPVSGCVDFRMPAPVHDVFSTSVANEIYKQLQHVAERRDSDGAFAAQIISGGSSRILLGSTGEGPSSSTVAIQRHPDAQFQHRKAAFPGVVLEVSYSQDGKNLKKLAWDYIQHSNGDIKAVIGLDINYGANPSTVSLWRPEYTREDGEDSDTLGVHAEIAYQSFRSPDLSHINRTQDIRLSLDDFATDALSVVSDTLLRIRFARLAELLDEAEAIQKAREQSSGGGVRSGRVLKKRRRSSSSGDCLLSDDEVLFCTQESTAMDKIDAEDQDFQPASKRRIQIR